MWFFKQTQQQEIKPDMEVVAEVPVTPVTPVATVAEAQLSPIEPSLARAADENVMQLLDKNGWWIDETVI